jgi:aryl carrier-like protein
MQAYILNEKMQLAPLGVAGELYLGGAGLGRGYLDKPALTAEKFLPDAFSREPGRRLYRTGDLVRQLPGGEIEYLGRNDQQLKLKGFRIELGEIEAVLEQHVGVKAAVVTLYEGPHGQSWLLGYVVITRESLPSTNELRAYLKERLPDYMVPQTFMVLDALPLLPNGKVNRRALPAPGSMRPDLAELYVAPRTEIEEVLAAIWSQVLGIEQVGIHDNFFELGGDSIRSVRMVALAKKRGFNFTVQQVFHTPTIARLEHEFMLQTALDE